MLVNYLDSSITAASITATGNFEGDVIGNVDTRTVDVNTRSYFQNITVLGEIDLSGASGNITADIEGNLKGNVVSTTGDPNAADILLLDAAGRAILNMASISSNEFTGDEFIGDFLGDLYSADGSFRVLDTGATGNQAYYIGDMRGNVQGNLLGDDSSVIVNFASGDVNGRVVSSSQGFQGKIEDPNSNMSSLYDLTIRNNLFVEGTTTTVNTDNLDIKDNTIVLNKGQSTGVVGVVLGTAGIQIDRGDGVDANLLWTEDGGAGYWDFTNTAEVRGAFKGNVTGDVYSPFNSGTPILDTGTATLPATYIGNVVGDIEGNVTVGAGLSSFFSVNVEEEIAGNLRGNVLANDSTKIIDFINNLFYLIFII